MASPKPAVIVRREFEATPEVVTQQLRACIVGPACQLVRYNKSAEKSKGLVETVASITPSAIGQGVLYAANAFKTIPNLAYSSVLDATSVKVFIDDAYLTYADIADDGDFRVDGSTNTSNALVLSATGWKGTNRNGGLVQDVAVGDIVQIYTGSAVLNKTTKVQGFTAEVVAGNVGAGTFTGAAAHSVESPTLIAGGVTFTVNTATAFDSNAKSAADPRRAGKVATTYTVAITSYDGINLGFSVTGDTGLDSIAGTVVVNGLLTLPSGVTVAAPASFSGVTATVGGSSTFVYGPAHVVYAQAGQGTPAALKLTTTSAAPGAGLTKTTTYYVTCISGGAVKSTAGCIFRVSTNNGADVVSTITVAGLSGTTTVTSKTIGSYGVTLNFGPMQTDNFHAGFVKGDVFTIVVAAASAGTVKTLVVADPYTVAGPISSVRLSKQVSLEVNQLQADASTTNWVLTSPTDADLRGVTISSAPKMRHSSVNSSLTDCRITAGKVYFQYRSFLAISPEVGSATTLADITAQLGAIDPDNDLAYGVYKAWSNANGATVHFIPTQSSDLNGTNGFAAALDLAKGNRNCYSLVPLSTSAEVWNAFVGHANDESAPDTGRFRIVWIAPEVDKHNKIQDSPIGDAGTILTASSSATGVTGRYYVTSALDSRFGQTARVGDYIRTKFEPTATGGESYVEYRVTAVVDNTTLIISAAVDPSLNNQKIQLFRDLSATELAVEYVKVSGSFSSERVFAVIPDRGVNGFRVDGVPVKNWYVACAFAGLRAGSRPHQPLSNVELLGFDGSNDTVMAFNETNLDTLRDGGCWVVRNAEDGTVYAERQLSTSTLDIYRKEQSVTCNIDSIAFSVADGLRNLVGRINISPDTLQLVETNLMEIMDTFLSKRGSATIGAQLLTYKITSVSIPTTAKDTVLVRLAVTLPVPMNVIDITIVI